MFKLILLIFCINQINTLPNQDDFYLKSTSLPTDLNYMPSLANGHLGFTVFGDSIYINGVYNGQGGNSRRARLPNFLNISVKSILDSSDKVYAEISSEYGLNLRNGYFEWQKLFVAETNPTENITIIQRYYAHRYFNRILIYNLRLERTNTNDKIRLVLSQNPGNVSNDFNLVRINQDDSRWMTFKATTRELENSKFQKLLSQVYIILNDNFNVTPMESVTINNPNNKILCVDKNLNSYEYYFIIAIDTELRRTVKEIEKVKELSPSDLLHKHVTEWLKFWQEFRIEIKGNLTLSQIVNAGIFYMATSLPSVSTYQPKLFYYGLSPTGLSRGHLDSDYQGHNFWDTEIWMLPIVTQMNINWALQLFEYRFQHLTAAYYNANITGFKGARYPWESAYTGVEVTNPCCPTVGQMEIHISADIIFAIQQFYTITQDQKWLCQTAWPLIYGVSQYLIDRVTYNSSLDQYHIKDVMGPDEDHAPINDNVYTNVLFKLALNFSSLALTICQPNTTENEILKKTFLNIAEKLLILYDTQKDYHPEYKNYMPDITVKQADAILLGYPLQYFMNKTTRTNDLMIYEKVTRKSGPAMTWSMFTINYLEIDEKEKADTYLVKSYHNYVHPVFKVWSEVEIGFNGSANFITGVGGFLQTLLFGYSGIRYHLFNTNKSLMFIKKRCVPSFIDSFIIKGFKFYDSIFSLNVMANNYSVLKCVYIGKDSLILKRKLANKTTSIPLRSNCFIELGLEAITIQAV